MSKKQNIPEDNESEDEGFNTKRVLGIAFGIGGLIAVAASQIERQQPEDVTLVSHTAPPRSVETVSSEISDDGTTITDIHVERRTPFKGLDSLGQEWSCTQNRFYKPENLKSRVNNRIANGRGFRFLAKNCISQ